MNDNKYIRCKRCHRYLTDLEARHRGYGKRCWNIYLREQQQKNSLFPIDNKGGEK